jgi:putative transposase
VKIHKGFKYRLLPSEEQKQLFQRWEGCNRALYNAALAQRQLAYSLTRKSLNYYDQANELKDLKVALPHMTEPPAPSLQHTLKHLHQGYVNAFEGRSGFPVFKRKARDRVGIHFPEPKQFQVDRVSKKKGIIDLPKVGRIKFWHSQKLQGQICNATLLGEGDKWYISIICELTQEIQPNTKPAIGLDLGCNVALTTSEKLDGDYFHHLPEQIKLLEEKLATKQRTQARKKKGSNASQQLRKEIGEVHRKIARVRHDWVHKMTTKITKNHGMIFSEDSDIPAMTASSGGTIDSPGIDVAQKKGLNRSILRQGWGIVHHHLAYKCLWTGGTFALVEPFNNSRRCRRCKHTSPANRERGSILFRCVACGYETHADLGASENIKEAGLASMAQVSKGTLILQNNRFVRASNQASKKKHSV